RNWRRPSGPTFLAPAARSRREVPIESALRSERRLQTVHEPEDRPPRQEGDEPGEHAVPRAGDDDALVGLPRTVAHLGDHGGRHRRSPVPGEAGLPGDGALAEIARGWFGTRAAHAHVG